MKVISGTKHSIRCRCILPTLKKKNNPPLHEFVVFSITENDKLVPGISQCNNCGITHRVIDFCKSEIIPTSENTNVSLTVDDIRLLLPDGVATLMEQNECELADYEYVKFMLDYNVEDEFLILGKEVIDEKVQGKLLKYKGNGKFSVEPFSSQEKIS